MLCIAACDGPAEQADRPADQVSGKNRPASARKVDITKILDSELVAAILDECHKPLKTRMQQVKVTVTLPDQRRLLVQADLPDCVRVREGKRKLLVRDGQVRALEGQAAPTAADDLLARQLAQIVDAVAFGPLYRAASCRREHDDYVLTTKEGTSHRLLLHDNTLLPKSLTMGGATVHIAGYLKTRTTWVANQVTLAPLGTCGVYFEDGGVLFGRGFFDVPSTATTSNRPDASNNAPAMRMTQPGTVRESESPTPILVRGKAEQWVLLKDPGDWQARHERYQPIHSELESQNQRIAGFPILFEQNGERYLAAPFRQRDLGDPIRTPNGWRLTEQSASRLLLVYPPKGSIDERIRTGTELLQRVIANRSLKALGPIRAQPFVHLHVAPPNDQKRSRCKVRMSVRIE